MTMEMEMEVIVAEVTDAVAAGGGRRDQDGERGETKAGNSAGSLDAECLVVEDVEVELGEWVEREVGHQRPQAEENVARDAYLDRVWMSSRG